MADGLWFECPSVLPLLTDIDSQCGESFNLKTPPLVLILYNTPETITPLIPFLSIQTCILFQRLLNLSLEFPSHVQVMSEGTVAHIRHQHEHRLDGPRSLADDKNYIQSCQYYTPLSSFFPRPILNPTILPLTCPHLTRQA